MAGTRTAPTVGALTVTENLIGVSVVDASEDTFSESLKVVGGGLADMAEIEAFTAAYQAGTQASVYEVRHTAVWTGSINPTNAEALYRGSVSDGINMGFRDTDIFNAKFGGRIVAPVAAWLEGLSDVPVVPPVGVSAALIAAYITLLGAGYSVETMQFTERRERSNNPKRKL